MKAKNLLILFIQLPLWLTAQPHKVKTKDTIIWKEGVVLGFEDFKGKPKPGYVAGTYSGITLYPIVVNNQYSLFTEAIFVCTQSSIANRTESQLRHEQKHFDMAEWYARKLRKELAGLDYFNDPYVQDKMKRVYDKVLAELLRQQENYDKETNHGNLQDAQKVWNQKIAAGMKQLEKYKNRELKLVH